MPAAEPTFGEVMVMIANRLWYGGTVVINGNSVQAACMVLSSTRAMMLVEAQSRS
jgi:hypothetical protein